MVGIITGSALGLEGNSAFLLGSQGQVGSAALERSQENVFLNAATGNLTIQKQDEFLVGRGLDASVSRTYNSLGDFSDDNGDNWRQSNDRRVYGLTGTLNTAGSTVQRVSGDGSVSTYSWSATASAYVSTDGAGAYDKLTSVSGVWTWTDGDSRTTESYAAYGTNNWRITKATDTSGNTLTFTYTASQLTKVTTVTGEYEQYSWSENNITQITTGYTDIATGTAQTLTRTHYGYDTSNRLTTVTVDLSPNDNSITDGNIYVTTYTYDGTSKRVASIAQTDGTLLAIGYDTSGRVTSLTQTISTGVTRVTTIAYSAGYTTITDPLGQATELDYNADGSLHKSVLPPVVTGAAPQVTQFDYDTAGDVISVRDPSAASTTYTYDGNGNALTVTDPLGNVTTRTYGSKNELLTETRTASDANSAGEAQTTRYAYDSQDRLHYMVNASGDITEYGYTSTGLLQTITEYPQQAYDISSLTAVQAPSETDVNNWKASIADLSSIEKDYYSYDARGNLTKSYTYGIATTAGGGTSTEGFSSTIYTYDEHGQLLSSNATTQNAQHFLYDGLGRITSKVDLAGNTTSFAFNDASGTTVVTLGSGQVQTSTYNRAGELISYSEAAANAAVNPVPDFSNSAQWGSSNLTRTDAPAINGQPACKYAVTTSGAVGRLGSTSQSVAASDTMTFEVTLLGSGTTLSDYLGVYGTTAGWGSSGTTSQILSGPGAIAQTTGGLYQVTGLSTTVGTRIRITRTFAGNDTAVGYIYAKQTGTSAIAGDAVIVSAPSLIKTNTGGLSSNIITATYQYDALGRLRVATDPTGASTYTLYDKTGRKTADVAADGSMVEYRYDVDNRLIATIHWANPVNAANLTALANPNNTLEVATVRPAAATGSLQDEWAWQVYDGDGRLVETIDGDGGVTALTYDASGQLVKTIAYANALSTGALKTSPPTTVQLPTADAVNDVVTRNFYDAGGRLVGTLDGLGHVTQAIYDDAGQAVEAIAYANATTVANPATATFSAILGAVATGAGDRVSRNIYDGQGLLRYTIDALRHVTQYSYDTNGNYAGTIVCNGTLDPSVTDYSYNNIDNNVVATNGMLSDTATRRTWTVYNVAGQVAYRIDANGAVTAFKYAASGDLVDTIAYANLRNDSFAPTLATMDTWAAVTVVATNAANRFTRGYYDGDGRQVYSIDGEGFGTRYEYDADGRVTRTYVYDAAIAVGDGDTLATITTALASAKFSDTRAVYDGLGRLTDRYDAFGIRTHYVYSGNGTLASVTTAYGTADAATTSYIYDAAGRVLSSTDATGGIGSQTYNTLGDVVTSTDALGNVSHFYYDLLGQLVATLDPDGNVTKTQYDAFGDATAITRYANTAFVPGSGLPTPTADASRDQTSYAYYDALGRVIATRDALGRVTETSYNAFGGVASVTRRTNLATGAVSTYPTVTASAGDAITTYAYDHRGRVTSSTDPLGVATTYTYDAFGDAVTQLAPRDATHNVQTTAIYDHRGLLKTQVVDSASGGKAITTTYGYDAFGRAITLTDADSAVTSSVYDHAGHLASTTDALGNTTSYAYDVRGNLVAVTDPLGHVSRYVYDLDDRKVATVDGLGDVSTATYDADGNVVGTRDYITKISLTGLPLELTPATLVLPATNAADHVTHFAYDSDNALRFFVDALGHITEYVRDAFGNVIHATAYDGTISTTSYTVAALVTKVAPLAAAAGNRITRSVYDQAGQQAYSIDAAGQVKAVVRDANGQVVQQTEYAAAYTTAGDPSQAAMATWIGSHTNATNDRTTYARYDQDGRLAYSVDALGDVTRYEYDKLGHVIRQTAYASPSSPVVTAATTLADLNTEYASTPSDARVTAFNYDTAGRPIETIDPTGANTHLVLDAMGRILSATTAYGVSGQASQTSFVYDANGRVVEQISADGSAYSVKTWSFYDAVGQKIATVDGDHYLQTCTYDAAGNQVSETQYATRITGAFTATSTVAALQALAGTSASDIATSATFDAFGRATSTTDGRGSVVSRSYDALDELTAQTEQLETGATDDQTTSYVYDNFGDVVKVTYPRGSASFAYYDTLGRVTRQVDALHYVTDTSYTRGGQIASVKRWGTALTGTISETTNPGAPASSAHDATTTFGYDKADRLTATTDAAGNAESYVLDAFGDRLSVTNKLGGMITYTYDKAGRALTETQPVTTKTSGGATINVSTHYTYDTRGNVTKTIEAYGAAEARTTNYVYDLLDRLTTTTHDAVTIFNPDLTTTASVVPTETVAYDHLGNVIETVVANAHTQNWYDAFGNKIASAVQTDLVSGTKKGTLSIYAYDADGNMTSMKIYGDTISMQADATGGVPSPVNSSNYHLTGYAYDRANRPTATTVSGVATGEWNGTQYFQSTADIVSSQVYDKNGNVVQQTDARGNSVYTWYDTLGHQVAQIDASKYLTAWTRDEEGNVLSETRYANAVTGTFTTATAASALSGLLGTGAVDADRVTTFTYDLNGNRLTEQRANVVYGTVASSNGTVTTASGSSTISYTYNGLGQVISKTEADGDRTQYTYDVVGCLILETDPSFQSSTWTAGPNDAVPQTVYAYDGLGDLTSTRVRATANADNDANDRVTTYIYGPGARLLGMTDANDNDRIRTGALSAGSLTHSYGYDLAGHTVMDSYARAGSGGGAAVTEAQVTLYDFAGRATTQTFAHKTAASVWTYATTDGGTAYYDATHIQYDAYGEVTGQTITGGSTSPTTAVTAWQQQFVYDAAGRLEKSNSGDGVWKFYLYDKNGNQTLTLASTGADLSATSFATFTASLQTDGSTNIANAVTIIAVYDKRNAATQVREPGRQLSSTTTKLIVSGKSYNAFGEVSAEFDPRAYTIAGVLDATTDAYGHAVKDVYTTLYAYNTMGRVTSKQEAMVDVTAANGAISHDIRPTEYYTYDLSGRQIATADANGNTTSQLLLAGTGYDDCSALVTAASHADGGVARTYYNVFGDAVKTRDELYYYNTGTHTDNATDTDEICSYDKDGQLIAAKHRGGLLTDYYAYDVLGQRIRAWNSQFNPTTPTVPTIYDRTDYDAQGRVVSQITAYGSTDAVTTTNAYARGTTGALTQTTTQSGALTETQTQDAFGRLTAKTDFGGHVFSYGYDLGGRLTTLSGNSESVAYTWYNTGLIAQEVTGASSGTYASSTATSAYEYDIAGNRTRENHAVNGYYIDFYYGNSYNYTISYQDARVVWDAGNRMVSFTDTGASGSAPASIKYEYDAVGNTRHMVSTFRMLNDQGVVASTPTTQDYWYAYDSMNRFTVTMGMLTQRNSGGAIITTGEAARGGGTVEYSTTGTAITYDKLGERTSALTATTLVWHGYRTIVKPGGTWHYSDEDDSDPPASFSTATSAQYQGQSLESYTYRGDGQILSVQTAQTTATASGQTILVGGLGDSFTTQWYTRDNLGRATSFAEAGYSATSTYNYRNEVTHQTTDVYQSGDVITTANYYYGATWDAASGTWIGSATGSTYMGGASTFTTTTTTKVGTAQPSTNTKTAFVWWDSAETSLVTSTLDTSHPGTTNTSTYRYDGVGHLSSVYIQDGRPRTVTFIDNAEGQILSRAEADNQSGGDPHELHYYFNGERLGDISNNGSSNFDYAQSRQQQVGLAGGTGAFRFGGTVASPYADFDQSYDPLNGLDYTAADSRYTVMGGDTLQSVAQSLWGDANLWYKLADANGLTGSETLAAGQSLIVPAGVQRNENSASTFRPYNATQAQGDLSPTAIAPPKKANGCGTFGMILIAVIAIAVTVVSAGAAVAALGPAGTTLGAGISTVLGTAGGISGGVVGALGGGLGGTLGAVAIGVGSAAIGSIVSQCVGVATGIQDSINWKGVALSALSGVIGAGIGPGGLFGKAGAFGGLGASAAAKIGETALRGFTASALTQGIGVATGLQDQFSWSEVATAGVGAAVGSALGGPISKLGIGAFGQRLLTNAAGGIANAATRSVIDGTDFGDNIMAALPDIIGQTIGDVLSGGLAGGEPKAAGKPINLLPKGMYNTSPEPVVAPGPAYAGGNSVLDDVDLGPAPDNSALLAQVLGDLDEALGTPGAASGPAGTRSATPPAGVPDGYRQLAFTDGHAHMATGEIDRSMSSTGNSGTLDFTYGGNSQIYWNEITDPASGSTNYSFYDAGTGNTDTIALTSGIGQTSALNKQLGITVTMATQAAPAINVQDVSSGEDLLVRAADWLDSEHVPNPFVQTFTESLMWRDIPKGPTWHQAAVNVEANIHAIGNVLNTSLGFKIPNAIDASIGMAARLVTPMGQLQTAWQMITDPQAALKPFQGWRDATVGDAVTLALAVPSDGASVELDAELVAAKEGAEELGILGGEGPVAAEEIAVSPMKARVLGNISESQAARASSNFSTYAARELEISSRNAPSWSTARSAYWTDRAGGALEGEFSPQNLQLMQGGQPPLHDELGVPMELHHIVPQRYGGSHDAYNLQEVWPWEHADIDPYRHYNGPRP